LSYRDIEELLSIRGVKVDHATIQRWVFKFTPLIEKEFRKRKKPVGNRWRLDETSIKVKGEWRYLYRAVDKEGNTLDFLLTKRRQRMSAQSFLIKAIENNGKPEMINIDKSGSIKSAIRVYNRRALATKSRIKIRQCKYLNNIVEQDHRFIKKRISQGLGFKEFESARRTIAGIEIVHMLKKNQLIDQEASMFKSFQSLVPYNRQD
jgi:putative transposase